MTGKIVGIAGAASIIEVGGAGIATKGFGLFGQPHWEPLFKDTGFFTDNNASPKTIKNDYKDKFGGTYKSFLVGLSENNKDWWNWRFKKLGNEYFNKEPGKFKEVNSGDSLKNKCEEAYKANETNDFSTTDNNKFKIGDVMRYCSPLLAKPTTSKKSNLNNKDFPTTYNRNKDNYLYWEIRNKEFYGLDGYEKMSVDSDHTYFSTKQNSSTKTHIKKICEEVYEKTLTSTTSSTQDTPKDENEVMKYCSLFSS